MKYGVKCLIIKCKIIGHKSKGVCRFKIEFWGKLVIDWNLNIN